jgi:hypothetical protein
MLVAQRRMSERGVVGEEAEFCRWMKGRALLYLRGHEQQEYCLPGPVRGITVGSSWQQLAAAARIPTA